MICGQEGHCAASCESDMRHTMWGRHTADTADLRASEVPEKNREQYREQVDEMMRRGYRMADIAHRLDTTEGTLKARLRPGGGSHVHFEHILALSVILRECK